MSNPYLDRLRGRIQEKPHPSLPSKLSKPGIEGFEGDQGCPFSEIEFSKSATTANPQNLQNLRSPSVPGDGTRVTIIEIPAKGLRYRRTFAHLQLKPPAYVPEDRWRQCVEDGKRFLAAWGSQAEALGWTSADLFGLAAVPEKPHPSYSRLSRYDQTGLVWLFAGCPVVALTADTASIRHPTGSITAYRKHHKPALGPLGDSLEDFR